MSYPNNNPSTQNKMTDIPNIILLTVDALRADHLSYYGYERNTSPFVDKLAQDELNFETAISASSHTREALPAILSGHHGDTFAANDYRYATDTVADKLSEQGYQTGGFHSNPYVSRAYGYDSGFDTFDDDLRLGQNRYIALFQRALDKFLLNKGEYHARAETINQRSLEWLDSIEGDEPFFLWNHYMDPHGPYNPPEGYTYTDRELSNSEAHDLYQKIINRPEDVTEDERQLLIDCYDGEIRYLDEQLKSFFSELEKRGQIEDSLIILTADHGDAFGEHEYYTHPRYLHEELLRVPLIVSVPGSRLNETVPEPVSTLSVAPTILETAKISTGDLPEPPLVTENGSKNPHATGVTFASATGEDENEGVRRFAVRGNRHKAIMSCQIDSGVIVEKQVFNLEADPSEQEPIDAEQEPAEMVEQLRSFSVSRLDSVTGAENSNDSAEPSAEVDDRLEALGYK